jgi:predicted HicB family RNase H-like nuclease
LFKSVIKFKIKEKMSKKIDIKRTLGKPSPPLSIEDVEAMTRQIHSKDAEPKSTMVVENPKMNVVETPATSIVATAKMANYEKTTEKEIEKRTEKKVEKTPESPAKRGRKPKMMMETERLLRVSVDLPESLFIQLKIAVIQQQTDMKSYIRQLVEKDMMR